MPDEADIANDMAQKYLDNNIRAARANKTIHRDAEATICGGCQYAAIAYGLKCSDWQSCLEDARRFKLL